LSGVVPVDFHNSAAVFSLWPYPDNLVQPCWFISFEPFSAHHFLLTLKTPVSSHDPLENTVFTVGDFLNLATDDLQHAGISRPSFEAQYLLQAVLNINKASLLLAIQKKFTPEQASLFRSMVARRLQGEPLQYIVGTVEFWSRRFRVTPDVLIPRQETEFVVEQALGLLKKHYSCTSDLKLLDMGTGSGVIADVLADELGCSILAVDISVQALAVAAGNIRNHDLQEKITLVCSDLFSAISQCQYFDCIVANPPYVAEQEKDELPSEVAEYEPGQALFAGLDGLECYRRLIPESISFLRSQGWLILEIGAFQEHEIEEMFRENNYRNIAIRPDYAGRPRFACGQKE